MTTLPEPDEHQPPEGCRWEWREETGHGFGLRWRFATDGERARYRCRWGAGYHRKACGRRPVAALNRSTTSTPRWWFYCGRHLFGRRLRDGRIEGRIAVPIEPGR